jgi:hypothetical protein
MTAEGKFIQKEGVRKVTTGNIVFLMNFILSMALIPFQYEKLIVHKKFLKARMN